MAEILIFNPNTPITPDRDEMLRVRGRLAVLEEMTALSLLGLHALFPDHVREQIELERERVSWVAADPSLAPDLSEAERKRMVEHMLALLAHFERITSAPLDPVPGASAPTGASDDADMA